MDKDAVAAYAKDLEAQLARARARPIWNLAQYAQYRMLKLLSGSLSPIPLRMATRMRRSAEKRDPNRSLTLSGRDESAVVDDFRVFQGGKPWDSGRQAVIIVTHEASMTGAPVLALNLGQELSGRYNVVFLILGRGQLVDNFSAASCLTLFADRFVVRGGTYQAMIRHVTAKGPVAFAIVNSVESHSVIPELDRAGLPIVTLIHEFAVYTPNRDKVFGIIEKGSVASVYSSPLTLQSAIDSQVVRDLGKTHVVPQGRCKVPGQRDGRANGDEDRRIRAVLRPDGSRDRFLVLGVGSIEYRKGIDFFIECANRIVNGPQGDRFDFVWIGGGYKPNSGYDYSVFLEDQIARSGLSDRLRILSPTNAIDAAYECADILLLPSRLDPLPNVTIDALCAGLPVICFDRATGIAPILQQGGLGNTCVASYLDPGDLSAKILALANDPEAHKATRSRSIEVARSTFDFSAYAAKIVALSGAVVPSEGPAMAAVNDGALRA